MLKIDRHSAIEKILNENGSIMVSNLSEILNVTEETIRRDLEELEKQKKLKRVRGGAFLPDKFDREVPIKIRETIYNEEKDNIADECLNLIEDGDSIMLDSSTTALHLAKKIQISKKNITIITNSLKISQVFQDNSNFKLICIGGSLRISSSSFVGYLATDSLDHYFADKVFTSCSTISFDFGITDNNQKEAMVRKKMIDNSVERYLIVDHTKFDSPSVNKICDISKINAIITNKKLSEKWEMNLKSEGVNIIYSI